MVNHNTIPWGDRAQFLCWLPPVSLQPRPAGLGKVFLRLHWRDWKYPWACETTLEGPGKYAWACETTLEGLEKCPWACETTWEGLGKDPWSGINLPAERGWVSKNLPEARGHSPRAEEQVFTDPPELCWQVDHYCSSNITLGHFPS